MGKKSTGEVRQLELKGYTSQRIYSGFIEKCKRIGLTHSSALHRLVQEWVEDDVRSRQAKSEWDKLGQVFALPSFNKRVNYGSSPARLRP